MAIKLAYHMSMKIANIAELKNRLSEYLSFVERGEEVEVRKRNVPIAKVVPIIAREENKTQLGCGQGTGEIRGNLTDPLIPSDAWDLPGNSK